MTTLQQDTAAETTPDATRPLLVSDRCDSCDAQAFARAVIGDTELLFCAHHARKHESKVKEIASVWHDETDRLYASN